MSVMDGSNFIAWAARQQSTHNLFNNETVVDHVLPDMIHLIDPHWYQFPPMHPLWYRILGWVIGVLGITSVLGNGMVIYIFSSTKTLRTPSNLLVVNLALSDFLMMCCISPFMVINCYYETWVFGPLHCTVDSTLAGLFGGVSIWTMTFVALDRYNVIVKGLSAKPLTTKSALFRIIAIWLISLSCAIAPAFGWSRYVPEGNLTACGCDYLAKDWSSRSYIIVYSIVCYFIPLSIIIYSYWFIVKAVAAHEKSMREQAKKMNVASLRSSEAQQTSAECKLAKIALMTISLWFMAWTPYLITNYIGIFEVLKLTPIMTIWCSLFSKSSAVYNPIVYAISHPKYRQALANKFSCLVCGTAADDTKSQTSDVTHATNTDDTPTTA